MNVSLAASARCRARVTRAAAARTSLHVRLSEIDLWLAVYCETALFSCSSTMVQSALKKKKRRGGGNGHVVENLMGVWDSSRRVAPQSAYLCRLVAFQNMRGIGLHCVQCGGATRVGLLIVVNALGVVMRVQRRVDMRKAQKTTRGGHWAEGSEKHGLFAVPLAAAAAMAISLQAAATSCSRRLMARCWRSPASINAWSRGGASSPSACNKKSAEKNLGPERFPSLRRACVSSSAVFAAGFLVRQRKRRARQSRLSTALYCITRLQSEGNASR